MDTVQLMDEIIVGKVKNGLGAWDKTCLLYSLTSQQLVDHCRVAEEKGESKASLHLVIPKLVARAEEPV